MRRQGLNLKTWLLPVGALVAIASCSDDVGLGGYQVTYRAAMAGVGTIDSVIYSDVAGHLVKVTAPAAPWTVAISTGAHPMIEAHLFGNGTAAGTANFVEVRMTATGTVTGDSTTATTAAATKFQVHLPTGCTTAAAPDANGVRTAACGLQL